MDANSTSPAHLLLNTGHAKGSGDPRALLAEAKTLTAILLLLSAAADQPATDDAHLGRLVGLLKPPVEPVDGTTSMLREVYDAAVELRRLVE